MVKFQLMPQLFLYFATLIVLCGCGIAALLWNSLKKNRSRLLEGSVEVDISK